MSAPDANGWMPIETAPKNETDILLIVRFGAVVYAPVVAAWCADGWYSQQTPEYPCQDNFTHWQNLPEPPVFA